MSSRSRSGCMSAATGRKRGDWRVSQAKRRNGALPDLFILDLHLPKVDGPEVLRTFRANRNCAKTPVMSVQLVHVAGGPVDGGAL